MNNKCLFQKYFIVVLSCVFAKNTKKRFTKIKRQIKYTKYKSQS